MFDHVSKPVTLVIFSFVIINEFEEATSNHKSRLKILQITPYILLIVYTRMCGLLEKSKMCC